MTIVIASGCVGTLAKLVLLGFLIQRGPTKVYGTHCVLHPSDGVFGRFYLAALGGCHTLNVCYVMLCMCSCKQTAAERAGLQGSSILSTWLC